MIRKKHIVTFYTISSFQVFNTTSLPIELQLILMNNGSLTQNFNSITGEQIKIQVIKQKSKKNREITRKVWIKENLRKLAFAESYWQKKTLIEQI
jgi:chorismate-pyruvate lyase